MTPDKKRFVWTLIAIAMFFANLMVVAVFVIHNLAKENKAPENVATTSGPAPVSPR